MLGRLLKALLQPPKTPSRATAPARAADRLDEAGQAYSAQRHADVVAIHARRPPGTPVSFEAALELGHSLQCLGRFEEAETVYAQVASSPDAATLPAAARMRVALHRGLSRLRSGDLEGGESLLAAASALDPSREDARRMAAFAGIMSEDYPLERGPLPPRPSHPALRSPTAPLDIAYYFTAPADTAAAGSYWRLFGASIRSARACRPDARIVLLTDEHTAPPASAGFDTVMRVPLPRGELMANRFRAAQAYVATLAGEARPRAAVLTESDCLLLRDPSAVLDGETDLFLTARSNFVSEAEDLEPCNTGVMVLDCARPEALASFFEACLGALAWMDERAAVRHAYARPIREWRGDQLAVGAVLGWRLFQSEVLRRRTDRLSVAGCRVALLPTDPYNYAPSDAEDRAALAGKVVLHFKGERKERLLSADWGLSTAPGRSPQPASATPDC